LRLFGFAFGRITLGLGAAFGFDFAFGGALVVVVASVVVGGGAVVAVSAVVVVVVGFLGWYYFMKPQKYPGFQAPPGGMTGGAAGASRMIPGQAPGTVNPQQRGPQ